MEGGKYKVSVSGSLSGSTEYDSKSSAESKYNSLDSYDKVAKWLGKDTKDHHHHHGGLRGIIGTKPKPEPEPEPEPEPTPTPPTNGNGGNGATESKRKK